MRLNVLGLVLLLGQLFFSPFTYGEGKVIGYAASWSANPKTINYKHLTHLNYSFGIPKKNGDMEPILGEEKLIEIVKLSHKNGIKILLAIGGWDLGDGGGKDQRFHSLAENSNYRANFISKLIGLVNKYDLDGIDMDWEYPDPVNGGENPHFTALMKELSEKLRPEGKLLTAAVAAYGFNGDGVSSKVFPYIDFLNLMAYDGGNGSNHSPFSMAERSIKYWSDKGLPKEKLVLGVPFYARPSWKSYKDLISLGADPKKDQFKNDYYNGIDTIRKKSRLALSSGAGVMIWELAQDTNDDNSLLKAISKIVKK